MASKQFRKAIEKTRMGKEAPKEYRCSCCGKQTINCIRKEDERGEAIYCVCSVCAMASEHHEAKLARSDRSRAYRG